ncbi:hypothetical protein PC129_g21201 [Phytophthora cactorum]|uniref:Uncharacterized protein n=1 Tax=Phytophthora cactorum TaxID=29920 RepID=A0A8T1H658_9STRA|nr:hypothetical protein PC129_g21201 [Phytophthora cactorum]
MWKTRDNLSARVGYFARSRPTMANSSQQQSRRHRYRCGPYQKTFQDNPSKNATKNPVETPKSVVLSPCVAELIGLTGLSSGPKRAASITSDLKTVESIVARIGGADHHITAELQQAIVADALKKKIRHRERSHLCRQKLTRVETDVNDAITKLRSEIKNLEAKGNDAVRLPTKLTSWALASEYFRQFDCYISSPRTLYKVASKFLHEIMAPDVVDDPLFGADAQLENWRPLTHYFGDVSVDLKGLKTSTTDNLVADTVTRVTITSNTLRLGFPHLNGDGVGGTNSGIWSPIAAKMLGKRLVMRGSVFFGWDVATGSLDDVSCAFSKARVSPNCTFVRGD